MPDDRKPLPAPDEFIALARKHFGFLEHSHFRFGSQAGSTGENVTFTGRFAAVYIHTDRRDEAIGFSIADLAEGATPPRFRDFFGYLIDHRGYRGGLSKFRVAEPGQHACEYNLQVYASALRHFMPRLVAGTALPFSAEG